MTRREFLVSAAAAAQAGAPPNIVLIVADDLGYGDLGCYGQKQIATPHIDRLATEGTRFTDVYAGAPICAPSRCSLMTGLHMGHARIRDNHSKSGQRVSLQPDDFTVAEMLKGAGYRTALIGKWGLGEAGTLGIPNDQGFDEFYGFLNQDHALEYFPTHLWLDRGEVFPKGNQGAKRQQYVQDLFTARALQFVARARQQPFFLYLAYTLPHASSELGRDTGDGFPVPDCGPYENRDWPKPERGYAATVHHLDRDVGRLMEQLKSTGIEGSTLVLFTSDNGGAVDGGHTRDFFKSAGAFREYKGSLYEGGIRVPMIARWPDCVPAGKTSAEPWAFWDVLPTLAELAGLPARRDIDGISIAPALLGSTLAQRHEHFYWETYGRQCGGQAVRLGNWKAVRPAKTGRTELYDLKVDPGETRDISSQQPMIVRHAEDVFLTARTETPDYAL